MHVGICLQSPHDAQLIGIADAGVSLVQTGRGTFQPRRPYISEQPYFLNRQSL